MTFPLSTCPSPPHTQQCWGHVAGRLGWHRDQVALKSRRWVRPSARAAEGGERAVPGSRELGDTFLRVTATSPAAGRQPIFAGVFSSPEDHEVCFVRFLTTHPGEVLLITHALPSGGLSPEGVPEPS